MSKHSRKPHRKRGGLRNANTPVPESCTAVIKGLAESLDGQEDFASCYLRDEYLSKYCSEDLVPATERRAAAIRKWFKTEETNAVTNRRLRGMDRGYNILPRVPFYSFLKFAQALVEEILGPLTDEVVVGSFSGGASTSRRRTESLPALKFTGQADVTEEAAYVVGVIHHEVPLFRELGIFYNLREVEGAKLFTVPKKSDIDRCACKEPDINMYLQKGVGRHIRRRLLRFGINLNDQSINRKLARQGSLDGSLATLDLSAASDSVTISCVQALLPTEWFLYLNDIRSQVVEVDGTLVRTEMFSSMGNGFTFELESLIFYVLMRTVSYFEGYRGVISVYGDDLIIPSGMFSMASWILSEFGFSLNEEKSFHTGLFRESCGGHYFGGEDVTPFYLKRPATRLTDVIRIANQLRLWALREPGREHVVPSMYKLWTKLVQYVPEDLWGGRDYAVDTQLVTPCPPTNRLVRIARKQEVPDMGSYASWHNTNWNRTREPEVGFLPVTTDNVCRRRRAIPGAPTLTEEFYYELFPMPDLPE
jgi:hypothetical protein